MERLGVSEWSSKLRSAARIGGWCAALMGVGCSRGSLGETDAVPEDAMDSDSTADSDATVEPREGVVRVVLFTHIEDNTPGGSLPSDASREQYQRLRGRLIGMAEAAKARGVKWVLQPDWKYLEAARLYEDAAMMADTDGRNVFAYLASDLDVAIDPHSHENGGYNYTDVAHLLDLLGVGGSTVIGGHIWDPALPQFQQWERFREPVAGEHYPNASWRGDILIGAGTPNHVNDPLVSGVWRPMNRDAFFEDDPEGNIVAFGAWANEVAGVEELVALYEDGTVPGDQMLTASWNVTPNDLQATDGIATIDADVLAPLATLQGAGKIEVTDFTSLVATWNTEYGTVPAMYRP
jgi:hypothetical protein